MVLMGGEPMNAKKTNKLNRNIILKQERLFNMKKLFLFVAALSVCALAAENSLEERVDGLTAQIDRVMSKAGIHFNGEFRSQFLSSTLDGDAVADFGKKTESSEYTSVDFNIVARPNSALSARAMFRLHQDWRNFFSDVQNPITSRWLSVDGSVANGIFKYNAGDYRKKLTPLTLWSPDFELLYEPEIFAQGRELAMSEVFLGGNNRVLQGANLELRGELGTESGSTILNELDVDIFGARLATRGSGESAPIGPGVLSNEVTNANGMYWDAKFDKYLIGANLAAQIIKGAGLGVSNIIIFDHVDSYRGEGFNSQGIDERGFSEDNAKLNSTSNNIFAGRVNFDNRAFMPDDFVRFGVSAEAALSSYQYHVSESGAVSDRSIDGMAVNGGLDVKFNFNEANALSLSANYIYNDSAFINEAAQSPSFVQRSIMNNENAMAGGLGVLNPFDAMYRSVFKYTPSQYFSESRPYAKNAYTNVIFTKDGVESLQARGRAEVFNVFQEALTGGMATADRVGPVVKLDGSFLEDALKLGARVSMLNGMSEKTFEYQYDIVGEDGEFTGNSDRGSVAFTPEYMTAGGGAIIDIAKFAPALGPSLKVGGSFMMYNSANGWIVSKGTQIDAFKRDNESQLMSAELNYTFVPRFSLLVGYQQLTVLAKNEKNGKSAPDAEYKFENLGVGFGYKVADGGALTVKLTRLTGEGPADGGTKSYEALQPEVYLTVKF
jgi:hypothetical protein